MVIIYYFLIALSALMIGLYFYAIGLVIKDFIEERKIDKLYKKMFPQYNNK